MSAQPKFGKPRVSIEDDPAAELLSDTTHEYDDGELVAMSGAGRNYERIKGNIAAALHVHLRGKPCEPFSSDLKIKMGQSLFYPDEMVVCQDTSTHEYYTEAPLLVVEVLSKFTRRREGWISNHYFLGDDVPLESAGLTFGIAEIYARVENEDMLSFLLEQQIMAKGNNALSDGEPT